MSDEQISRVLELLLDPDGPAVIPIGCLPAHCLSDWSRRSTDDIVITRDRRNHYLASHPEMHQFEYAMIRGIVDPEELHRNKSDGSIAIAYAQVSATRWIQNGNYRVTPSRTAEFSCELQIGTHEGSDGGAQGRSSNLEKAVTVWRDCRSPHSLTLRLIRP